VRRALLALSVLPVWAIAAVLLPWFWPWAPAAGHLLVLALLGSLLADIFLREYRKIPFTCSYLPGKSKVHMVFWAGVIPLVWTIHKLVELEQKALASPLSFAGMSALLAAFAYAARRVTDASPDWIGPEIQFEESPSDELTVLGLNR
jgi:hypothetical protein